MNASAWTANKSVVVVTGEIDMFNVAAFEQCLRRVASATGKLLVDLSRGRYFECSGIGAIVRARTMLRVRPTVVVAAGTLIRRVLALCGLLQAFNVKTIARLHSGASVLTTRRTSPFRFSEQR